MNRRKEDTNILFFDTETTGLPKWNAIPADPAQPHIVQLAGIVMNAGREIIDSLNVLVMPEGYEIPAEASAVHGISTYEATAKGIPAGQAIWQFERMAATAGLRVAHNISFDDLMLRIAYSRLGMTESLSMQPSFCTMQATTPICKLPGRFGKYKWPKLAEAYRHFFAEDFADAHDAMADLTACAKVYFAIQDQSN